MSNLLVTMGHTERRVVLGYTLNTLQHIITHKKSQCFKQIYDLVLGCIRSHPELHVARGPQVGHPLEVKHPVLKGKVLERLSAAFSLDSEFSYLGKVQFSLFFLFGKI